MPLDPHAKRLLDMLALGDPAPSGSEAAAVSAPERRRAFKTLMGVSRARAVIGAVADLTLACAGRPLPVRLYTPVEATAGTLPGLVFFHGGGLVAGDLDTHDALCRRLANVGRCRVLAVEYRVAPEHPFPAAVEDAAAAVASASRQAGRFGIDPSRLAVAGDSAGGTLAVVAAAAARDTGGPALAFMLLLCPVLDLSTSLPSRRLFGRGYMLDQATIDRDLADYLPPGATARDPRVSPLLMEDLAGLPRVLLHTAEFDPLRDEGQAFADRLGAARVPVHHTLHAGMIHHFLCLEGVIPAAATALEAIGAAMREQFAR